MGSHKSATTPHGLLISRLSADLWMQPLRPTRCRQPRLRRTKNEPCTLGPKHLERRHALHAEPDAHVRDLDFLRRGRRHLVRDDNMLVRMRVRDEVVVRCLEEDVHRGRFVAGAARPIARGSKAREDRVSGFTKKSSASVLRPLSELVIAPDQLVTNLLDAENRALAAAARRSSPRRPGRSRSRSGGSSPG